LSSVHRRRGRGTGLEPLQVVPRSSAFIVPSTWLDRDGHPVPRDVGVVAGVGVGRDEPVDDRGERLRAQPSTP
jgi:hypothetical protein